MWLWVFLLVDHCGQEMLNVLDFSNPFWTVVVIGVILEPNTGATNSNGNVYNRRSMSQGKLSY